MNSFEQDVFRALIKHHGVKHMFRSLVAHEVERKNGVIGSLFSEPDTLDEVKVELMTLLCEVLNELEAK